MKNNENKKRFSLYSIIENDRILMIISIILAFIIWLWVAIEKSPEVQHVITGVPVSINLENSIPEQLDLQIFGKSDFTVDVTVKGRKYVVSTLSADNISVEANVNYVDSPGIKTLQLKITPKNSTDDFSIVSSSSNYIEVFFDNYKEIELPLVGKLISKADKSVPDGCILGDAVCSQQTVLVTGPATEVNRVVEVNATATTDKILDKTTTYEPSIKLISNDDSKLQYAKVESNDSITMTVPVLKVLTLPTSIEFKNAPSQYLSSPLAYTISPSSIKVAVPIENVETLKTVVVDTIDFSDIYNTSNNKFKVNASNISGVKIMDPSIKVFDIRINASGFEAKTIPLKSNNFTVKGKRDDFSVEILKDKVVSVTLIGTSEDLSSLDESNVNIELDLSDKVLTNDTTLISGKVVLPADCNCWAVGKYDVKVSVTEK